jgi:hypothetical protein
VPRGFKPSQPYIKNINDAKVTEKDGVTFFTLADEELTGSPTQEFHIVDVLPGKTLALDTPKSDVIAYMYNGKCDCHRRRREAGDEQAGRCRRHPQWAQSGKSRTSASRSCALLCPLSPCR